MIFSFLYLIALMHYLSNFMEFHLELYTILIFINFQNLIIIITLFYLLHLVVVNKFELL